MTDQEKLVELIAYAQQVTPYACSSIENLRILVTEYATYFERIPNKTVNEFFDTMQIVEQNGKFVVKDRNGNIL